MNSNLLVSTFLLLCFLSFTSYATKNQKNELSSHNSPETRLKALLELSHFDSGDFEKVQQSFEYASLAKILADSLRDEDSFIEALILQGSALSSLKKREQGIDSIQKGLDLAINLENDALQADAYFAIGLVMYEQDKLQIAINNYEKALELYLKLNNQLKASFAFNNLGQSYFNLGNLEASLSNYLEALKIKQTIEDQEEVAVTLNNLAIIYKELGNFNKALLYNKKSINIQESNKDTFSLSLSFLNVGNIYRKMEKYDSAAIYHEMALNMSSAIDDTVGMGYAHYNLGSVYFDEENYAQSKQSYLNALDIFTYTKSSSLVLSTMTSLSSVYANGGEIEKAEEIAKEALSIAKDLGQIVNYRSLLKSLYNLSKTKGNYEQALKYHEQFVVLSDSILNQQKLEAITELETNFEIAQRDNEIELLSKANELSALQIAQSKRNKVIYSIIAILLIVVIIAIYRSYHLKKVAEKTLAEKNIKLEELNSAKDKFFAIIAHDLRSPLSAFRSLTTGLSENFKSLPEHELQQYLLNLKNSSDELIGLLHNLLQWALSQTKMLKQNRQQINLNDILLKNINLLEESAEQKNIQINTKLSESDFIFADAPTIDLVFRNLISNAIKFTDEGGTISVQSTIINNKMNVAITDNGIGMSINDTKKLFKITEDTTHIGSSKEKGTGLGLILCKEFLDKNQAQIEVESTLGKGSTFKVILPTSNFDKAA